MTREEAITLLKKLRTFHNGTYAKAIDMAIEALSQPIVAKHFDIQSGYIYCSPQDAENVKEVVRCKDCRYYNNDYMGKWCGRHQAPVWVKDADFCSWARMKGGDTE